MSGCYTLPYFKLIDDAYPWLFSKWVAACHTSLHFKPIDDASPWPLRMWVAPIPNCVLNLPTMSVLDSREWVATCHTSLHFKPTDAVSPCITNKWVAFILYCVLSMLTISVLDSLESESLPYLAAFPAYSQNLSLAFSLQVISTPYSISGLIDACSWLFRM